MPKLFYTDDNCEFSFSEAQNILKISQENEIDHLHVCGGLGKCSTCRVQIIEGLDNCSERSLKEQNIAEKLETLESQRERLGEVDWKQELENYKESEAERRQEDRLYFQSKLAEFETASRDQSYDQEREAMLRQDSVRLQTLDEEIQNLKSFLGADDLSEDQLMEAQSSVQNKIQEKASLDAQISEKLAMLDQVQYELDSQPRSIRSNGMLIFVAILSALVIALIVVLVFVMMNKPKEQMLPPWMMYPPPRRPKKKDNRAGNETPAVAQPQPVAQAPAPQAPSPEDVAVLQSEVNDMKQAVVSMSVGQPQAATKIVKDWILEEAPPEPEPVALEPEEGDSGKKKKKKKK